MEMMADIYCKIVKDKPDGDSIKYMLRKAFAASHVDYAEVLYYPYLNKANIGEIVHIEGRHHLDDALARKQSVIITFFHFGSQKLIMPALGYGGYPINQLAAPPTIWKELDGPNRKSKMYLHSLDLEKDCEKNFPVTFHYTGNSIRPLIKCLQNGEILLYALDGGYGGKKNIKTRFGKLDFDISDTPFRLARATGAIILPAFHVRGLDFNHTLHIHKPIVIDQDQKDFTEPAQFLMNGLYDYFVKHPCHYLGQLWLFKVMGRI